MQGRCRGDIGEISGRDRVPGGDGELRELGDVGCDVERRGEDKVDLLTARVRARARAGVGFGLEGTTQTRPSAITRYATLPSVGRTTP
jgi:hypothetical protein